MLVHANVAPSIWAASLFGLRHIKSQSTEQGIVRLLWRVRLQITALSEPLDVGDRSSFRRNTYPRYCESGMARIGKI